MDPNEDESLSRGELTREQIISAGYDLFIHQGFHGTSMRQIAGQAGIALGGLYNHFPSKEAVFEAVFERFHPYQEVIPALKQAQGNTIEELVKNGASIMIAAINRRPNFLNLLFIEIVEFNGVHIQDLFVRIYPMVLQVAQRFQEVANHRMRPIPPPILMRSFLGLFFSYFITEYIFSPKAPLEFSENGLETLLDIYLHGLLMPESLEEK